MMLDFCVLAFIAGLFVFGAFKISNLEAEFAEVERKLTQLDNNQGMLENKLILLDVKSKSKKIAEDCLHDKTKES